LDFEWIDRPERWLELRGLWDDAVAATASPSIFATFDFLEACWTHFALPYRNELAVLALWDAGRLAGFAPLRLSTRRPYGVPRRKLSMLSDWESDRAGVAFPAGREKDCTVEMLRFLADHKRRWDVLKLREVTPDGGVARGLAEGCPAEEDLSLLGEDGSPSPFVPLEGLTWDEYLSRLGARTRKNVRRYLHHLEAGGGYALETFDRAEDMERALDLYLGIEARSWKRPAGQGIGKDARNEGFYRDLLPRLAHRGWTSISFLRFRNRRIAALIEHSMNGVVYAAETTFDEETAPLSPGAALQALCLERRMELGAREYELFAMFLKDKLRWTSHVRHNRDFVVEQRGGLRNKIVFAGRGILRQLRGVGGPALAPRP
jgi:CelD/BcsL family acetyltransferase involved in cellulose biosynthesis